MKALTAVTFCLILFSCSQKKKGHESSIESTKIKTAEQTPIEIEFKTLANFDLPIPDPTMADRGDIKFISDALPKEVSELNNKKVTIKGFMLPLEYTKEERIKTFLLTPDQGACCFGKVPSLNGVIFCTSTTAYPDLRDTLLEVTGILTTEPSYNKKDEAVYLYIINIEAIKELKAMPPIQGPGLSF